jgi:hypothetical protein
MKSGERYTAQLKKQEVCAKFWSKNLMGTAHLEELNLGCRIILNIL